MSNPRPTQTHCAKGHEKKPNKTTGALYCPICQKESDQKRRDVARAERISKRIRPLYT